MRRIPQAELLRAMKQSLRDLDNLKLLNPNDLEILHLRRTLREQIDRLERQQSELQAIATPLEQESDYEITA